MSISLLAGMPVFAANEGTTSETTNEGAASETRPTVNKTVSVPQGVIIDNTNITFDVAKLEENADGVVAPKDGNISVAPANFNGLTSADTDKLKQQLEITETNLQTGEYTFQIKENSLPDRKNDYGWTNTSVNQIYFLHIYVDNQKNKKYIVTTNNALNKDKTALNNKVDSIDFTNKFTKQAALSITKTVPNPAYETPGQKYKFTVKFDTDKDQLNPVKEEYSYTIDDTAKTVASGEPIYLASGETANFDDIPAGTKVTVVEEPVTNLKKVDIDVTSNGEGPKRKSITDITDTSDNLSTGEVLIGEGTNSITFTNNYKNVTATGVITNIAPYVALVVAAVAGCAAYMMLKKRMAR